MKEIRTKIICTIGPASWDPEVVRDMIEAGMNVVRVNGAFADPEELDKVAKLVRDVSDEVALMVDVKGPEIRLNKFPEPVQIAPGDEVTIGSSDEELMYAANYPDLHKYISEGQRIILGDGDVQLIVKDVNMGKIICDVTFGQFIKPGASLNVPGCEYSKEILTEKDKENLRHAIETDWDLVSASFIRNAEAARAINEFIGDSKMKLIAKIEDEEGVNNIDEILKEVCGIMIARGGLGVEMGLAKIPLVQNVLIKRLNTAGLPVITATQMLESMTKNPRPTRAEATDVTNAILQGTDAVMLSGESAMGKYPVEAVKVLVEIAREAEESIDPKIIKGRAEAPLTTDAIAKAAAGVCINMKEDLDSVIVVSKTGTTARLLSRHNVKQPIFVFTSSEIYKRALMLSKGITKAFLFEGMDGEDCRYDRDCGIKTILDIALKEGIVQRGQKILFLGKTPVDKVEYFPNLFEIVRI
jgi:pyruvate kinase